MKELFFASIKTLKEKLNNKEISKEELLKSCINRFKSVDKELGSALKIFDEESILNSSNNSDNILAGIPGLVKDNIFQKDRNITCASKILENYYAPYDSTVSSRLKSTGALLVGTANMDEFAMGSSTETSAFKKTKNPWDLNRVPGGSSGGSAAAVASGLVPWSLGSDTGGSIRQPAAFCGIVGLKPTYGLVSRYGLIAYGSSLDCIGPLTRNVYDNALVLSAIAGYDKQDSSSLNVEPTDYTKELNGKLKENFTLGIIENMINIEGIDSEVLESLYAVIEQYKKLGAKIKYISLPSVDYSAATYFIISRAEAASNLARFDGVKYGYRSPNSSNLEDLYCNTRSEGFGKEVQRRILIGNYVLSSGHADEYYGVATKARQLIRAEFLKAFEEVDLLLSPISPTSAFTFGEYADNKLQMDLQDYFTAAVNLAKLPAITLPCGFDKLNMPIGFQLIGPDLSEQDLLKAAYAYESVTDWNTRHPKI